MPASRVPLERGFRESSVLAFCSSFLCRWVSSIDQGEIFQVFSTWLSLRRVTVLLAGARQQNHLVLPGEGGHAGRAPVAPPYHGFRS